MFEWVVDLKEGQSAFENKKKEKYHIRLSMVFIRRIKIRMVINIEERSGVN